MCDYSDCRSHAQLASLSADHDVLLGMLSDLERAVDETSASRAAVIVDQLWGLIERHAADEERGNFTQLRHADVDAAYIAMFETEHEEIHSLLASCLLGDWGPPARALIEVLSEHISREETDLFPAAHQVLSPRQWDAIEFDDVTSRECEHVLARTTGGSS